MNLEYEIQMRNCYLKQRKSKNKRIINKEEEDKKEKKEENPCNINYPICTKLKNFNNRKKPLIEFWGISQKINTLTDKNFIIDDYFFKKIKQKKIRSKKLNQSNKDNIKTTKSLLENLNSNSNKSMELDTINLSKSIEMSSIEENENLKNKNLNENENDIMQINEVKKISSVYFDKINLTNLQIVNINLLTESEINLITNFDEIEKCENEDMNSIDNLKIERN